MDQTDARELNPESEFFMRLCAHLNAIGPDEDAKCEIDLLSGGYKFSDEVPAEIENLGDYFLPLVDLLRCLWGYRASIVVGSPRPDLAAYWEAAKKHAPRWAGFSPERYSVEMKIHVENADRRAKEFVAEMDRMDRNLRMKSSSLARS